MDRILIITQSSLSTNPRTVKEIEVLKNKFLVDVVCFEHGDWSKGFQNEIFNRNKVVDFHVLRRDTFFKKLWVKLSLYICRFLHKFLPNNFLVCSVLSNDKSLELLKKVKKLDKKYVRVIAHNLGAFYAATWFSENKGVPLQLDIEDFHPGEFCDKNWEIVRDIKLCVMKNAFKKASYITYASTGIKDESLKVIQSSDDTIHAVLRNSFFQHEFDYSLNVNKSSSPLKCVWFSQVIAEGRGLEMVFEAANRIPTMEFHLIGNKRDSYTNQFDISDNVFFHPPMSQPDLHLFLQNTDIGLSLEQKDRDINRDICLTNKVFAYAQSGNYILATDTFGHRDFFKSIDYDAGQIFEDKLFQALIDLDNEVFEGKEIRRNKAFMLSWEEESKKLFDLF